MTTYHIIRYHRDGGNKVTKRGLSLEEAQAHCRRADTRGTDAAGDTIWFDGYDCDDPDNEEA